MLPPIATFSIVGFDPQEQAWGIAVASKFPAVGAVVPWAAAGSGAVATQSYANTSFGPRALATMGEGLDARQALEALLRDDAERETRQVGLVDRAGNAATFTGSACHAWAGGVCGECFAAQGNILHGSQTIEAMARVFSGTPGDLPDRLMEALLAGDRAGGDRRGKQSAAILVVKQAGGYGGYNDRWIDYRVDDAEDPVPALKELLKLHALYFGESAPEDQLPFEAEHGRMLQRLMLRLGYYAGEINGEYDAATSKALRALIGNENFEDRFDAQSGHLDRPVIEYLFKKYAP